jgi:integrase
MTLHGDSAGSQQNSEKSESVGRALANRGTPKRYTPDSGPGAVAHLYLRELPSGRQTWVVIRRPAGSARPVTVTLGREDALPRKDARKLAERLNAKLSSGINPNVEKAAARSLESVRAGEDRAARLHTFHAVGRAYIQRCEKGTRRRGPLAAATTGEYRRLLEGADLKDWHQRPVSGITPKEVDALIGRVGARAPVAANRLFGYLSAVFNFAIVKEFIASSPLKLLDRDEVLYREPSRRRTLVHPLTGDLSELVALWRGIETIEQKHHPFSVLVKLLIFTGARVGTFARAHPGQTEALLWRHVKDLHDPQHARIEVPTTLRKTGNEGDEGYSIALSSAAVECFDELGKASDDAPVFTLDGIKPLKVNYEQWDRIREAASKAAGHELERFTLHDLRRTVSTGLGHLGCPAPVQDTILDHAGEGKRGIAGIYNRAQLLGPSREWLTRWAEHVKRALNTSPLSL